MSREKEAHETTPGALLTPFNIGHRRALAVSPTGNLATPCRLAKVIGCSRLATYRERFRETSDARIPKEGWREPPDEFAPRTTRLLAFRTRYITDASVMSLLVRISHLLEIERQGKEGTILEDGESDAVMRELLGEICSIIDRAYGSTDVAKVESDLSSLLSGIFVL